MIGGLSSNRLIRKQVGNSLEDLETTEDKLFLLSEVEVFGSTTFSVPGEGTQYAYYKAGNSREKEWRGAASSWWLRSPRSGNNSQFCRIDTSTIADYFGANNTSGVAFAFCI